MKNTEKCDLIVVGGGPAGSIAAMTASGKGLKTVLLEKNRYFGIPVRCAETVAEIDSLDDFLKIDPRYLQNTGKFIRVFAPNRNFVTASLKQPWGILNRKVFDNELAVMAAGNGASVRNRCCVTGLERIDGDIRIKYEHYGESYTIQSPIVIGADGTESRVGRWAGIDTSLPISDLLTCWQYTLMHKDIEPDSLDAYFGREIAPGGYIWVFPKDSGLANVGIGIPGHEAAERSPREYLDRFIEAKFPGASYLSSIAGSVPSRKIESPFCTDNVLLAGDAAHQACPLTGGGIVWGMWGGKYAAETAVKALNKGDFSAKHLGGCQKSWTSRVGAEHNRKFVIRNIFRKMPDDVLNSTIDIMKQAVPEKSGKMKLIRVAALKAPGVVRDALKAYFGGK